MDKYGTFGNEEVIAKWLKNKGKKDRDMEMDQNFTYIDPFGKKWTALKGDKINGASIPSWAWGKTLGSPFVGDFRRASVVHDVACDRRQAPYKEVHKMFYYAMRCDGVKKRKASIMYIAVLAGGPKWDINGVLEEKKAKIKRSDMERLEIIVDQSLSQIESSADLEGLEKEFVKNWNRALQDGDERYL
jgi:Protein of unknown function (DUF1353)